ncbi:MAG: hypothetical protein J0I06_28645, partial [Planctomycetes bacterium]|nr:hypothetical protein [Planctomycetota bacterium]
MEARTPRVRGTRRGAVAAVAAAAVALLAGCSGTEFLRRTCPAPRDPQAAAEAPHPSAAYRVGCPDVLDIAFRDRPDWDAVAVVDVDGRLPLEQPGNPRGDGLTLDQIRDELAALAGCPPERVRVSLAAARSGR